MRTEPKLQSQERTFQKPGNLKKYGFLKLDVRTREAAEGRAAGQGQRVGGGGVRTHTRAPDFKLVVFACASGESVVRSPPGRETRSAEGPGAQWKARLPERARDPGLGASSRSPRPQEAPPPGAHPSQPALRHAGPSGGSARVRGPGQ